MTDASVVRRLPRQCLGLRSLFPCEIGRWGSLQRFANEPRSTAWHGITSPDHRMRNAKLEHTVRYWTARADMRIIELENRCTGNRTGFESHPLRHMALIT